MHLCKVLFTKYLVTTIHLGCCINHNVYAELNILPNIHQEHNVKTIMFMLDIMHKPRSVCLCFLQLHFSIKKQH
jgi:hypothetical protein